MDVWSDSQPRRGTYVRPLSRDELEEVFEMRRVLEPYAARKAAEQKDVDISKVKGSGDAGRVMRRDVEQASTEPAKPESRAEAPAQHSPAGAKADVKTFPTSHRREEGDRTEERVRMSKRRATIAKRLVEVQSTAAMLTRSGRELQSKACCHWAMRAVASASGSRGRARIPSAESAVMAAPGTGRARTASAGSHPRCSHAP